MHIFTPGSDKILHTLCVDFQTRQPQSPVHLVQYDNLTPILAVRLYSGGAAYTIPDTMEASLRARKPDGTALSYPALGVDDTGTTVYVSVTEQLTACAGAVPATLELRCGDRVAASAPIPLMVDRNPLTEADIASISEIITQLSLPELVISETQPTAVPVLWFDVG